jgi:trimethylamine---corrinoid protein Co-methyltransferase
MKPFQITPPLTETQLEKIDNAALDILNRIGVQVPHGPIRELLNGRPGIKVDGDIVRYEPALVREQIKGIRGYGGYDTHIIAGAYSANYLDPLTDHVRPPTVQDLVTSIRQADAFGIGVCAPVVPLDISGPRQELVMERLTFENARFAYGAGQATHVATAEASLEMSQAAGRPHGLELWVNSPLKLDGKGLDILWQLRHRKPQVKVNVKICSVPIRGMSTPVFEAAALAQNVAECLAGITTLRLLNLTGEISYRIDAFTIFTVDMQSGNVLLSGPDCLRLALLTTQIAKHHGIPVPAGKTLLTSAKRPGLQAGAEKTSQTLALAMAGADVFMAAGALSADEIFSPLQMIIDLELMSFVDAVLAPLDFNDDQLGLDLLKEVGPGGMFLDHETTARHSHHAFWNSKLFSQNSLFSWMNEGSPALLDRARETLNSLSLRQSPAVSPEIQKELQKIETHFAQQL